MSFRIDDILKPELKGERKENEKKQTEESRNFRSHSFGGKLSHENELQCVSEEQFPGTPQMLCEKTHFLREKPNFSFAKISHYSEVPQRSSECNYFSEDSFCLGYNEKPQLLNESILQRTLLNRSQFPRSFSDPLGISKYNFLNCERFCDAYAAHNFYGDVPAHVYPNVYTRPRLWPIYPQATLPYPYGFYSKRKGGQVRFSASQTDALEKRFMAHKYLSPEDRKILADSLKLTDRQVKTWFQNRRAKWRRSNSISSNNTSGLGEDSDSDDCREVDETPTSSTSLQLQD